MNEGGVCVILFNRLEDAFLGGMVHGDNEHEALCMATTHSCCSHRGSSQGACLSCVLLSDNFGGKALMMGNLLHRDCACDNVESNLTGQLQARILTEPNQYLESGGKRGLGK